MLCPPWGVAGPGLAITSGVGASGLRCGLLMSSSSLHRETGRKRVLSLNIHQAKYIQILHLKSQIMSCLCFDTRHPLFYELVILIIFLFMSFDKNLKISHLVLPPPNQNLKFFLSEIPKTRLETLDLEVGKGEEAVMGRCLLRVLWGLLSTLHALFSQSCHLVFPSGPRALKGQGWNAYSRTRSPETAGVPIPPAFSVHPSTLLGPGQYGLACVPLGVCLGPQRPLLTAEDKGKIGSLNLIQNQGLSLDNSNSFPL